LPLCTWFDVVTLPDKSCQPQLTSPGKRCQVAPPVCLCGLLFQVPEPGLVYYVCKFGLTNLFDSSI